MVSGVNVTDSRKLRIGIIGCGVGFLHLQGFAENPRAQVVAIAGLDEERCRDLAKQFDVPRVYRDYQDLVADPDIEAVTVAVPTILHVPVALAALEAGKHVMVEKPLAPTAVEGQRIIDAARRAERVLGVVFNRRGR
jgi:predicted dehydrogenase